jgi:hypothetical protein
LAALLLSAGKTTRKNQSGTWLAHAVDRVARTHIETSAASISASGSECCRASDCLADRTCASLSGAAGALHRWICPLAAERTSLCATCTVYSRKSFDPEHLLRTLADGGASFTSLVPTHY